MQNTNDIILSRIDRYFSKRITAGHIGLELEYPIVCVDGTNCSMSQIQKFLTQLNEKYNFSVSEYSNDNKIIKLYDPKEDFTIALEFSFHTIELIFPKKINLIDIDNMVLHYLKIIQSCLLLNGLSILDLGFNQQLINHNKIAIDTSHYQTLEEFCDFFKNEDSLIKNTSWPGLVAASQTHIDINKEDICELLNILTEFEFINNDLFENSPYIDIEHNQKIKCFRKYCYENSGFNLIPDSIEKYKNIGSLGDLCEQIGKTGIYFSGKNKILFQPVTLSEFINLDNITGYEIINEKLTKKIVQTRKFDKKIYRNIKNFALTRLGTVETRMDCCQPIQDTMLIPAYYLGIFIKKNEITQLITDINNKYGKKHLCDLSKKAKKEISFSLYKILYDALKIRNLGEEKYILPLYERISRYKSPSELFIEKIANNEQRTTNNEQLKDEIKEKISHINAYLLGK